MAALLSAPLIGGITVGQAMSAVGTLVSALGSIRQSQQMKVAARAQEQAAAYQGQLAEREAQNLEIQAGQERAAAQRGAIEQRRQGRFVSSRATALAAASGAGALDPTIVNILGDIDTEAELRAMTALYEGEEAGRSLEYGAAISRAQGRGAEYAGRARADILRRRAAGGYWDAAGTLISGGSSLFAKYATEAPPTQRSSGVVRRSVNMGPFGYNYG